MQEMTKKPTRTHKVKCLYLQKSLSKLVKIYNYICKIMQFRNL